MDRITQFGVAPSAVGAAGMSGLTLFQDVPQMHESPEVEEARAYADSEAHGAPQFILVGFVLILLALWLAHKKSGYLQREALGVNLFNLVTVGITAVLFIALGKILFARFPVKGLSALFSFV